MGHHVIATAEAITIKIKRTIEKVPGGMMVIPLMLGAAFNTIDQLHIPWVMDLLQSLGVSETEEGHYEFMRIGGFTEALFKTGTFTLIGLFLFCAGSQMDLRVGGRSIKKGLLLMLSKAAVGVPIGIGFGLLFDPMHGPLGLSTLAIIAAITNGNEGMYAALTGQYGNRSDVGAISVLTLNDGPFLTMIALGMVGSTFPVIAFIAVLLPIALGMLLGNIDGDIRDFLSPGEQLLIPFFAFTLGAGMNFMSFFNPTAIWGGLALGIGTTILVSIVGIAIFRLFRERSTIGPVAEASTAGNAVSTPIAVAAAATVAANSGRMPQSDADAYHAIVDLATMQISIAAITTSVLCPIAVILWDRHQKRRGIDATHEPDPDSRTLAPLSTR